MSNDEDEWCKKSGLRPVLDIADAVDHLVNALDWLDANGKRMAAMHVNQALEVLLDESPAPGDRKPAPDTQVIA